MKHIQEKKRRIFETLFYKKQYMKTTKKNIFSDIQHGDILQLWNHFLLYWDSTNEKQVQKLLESKKIKSIIADVPYGIDYVESKKDFTKQLENHKHIKNDEFQSEDAYKKFSSTWMSLVRSYLCDKNSFYIFNSDKMIFSLREALNESSFKFSQLLIWIKNGWVIGRLDYLPQHELIAYGWYNKHEFLRSKGKSIFFVPKIRKNTIHPTMKPIPLLRELILNSTNIWDFVYDPFLGSWSTMMACEQTKRKCIGIEIEKEYIEKICKRYHKLFGVSAVKL